MACRFRAGDRVRVRGEFRPGHVRTPAYIRGKPGVVTEVHGSFRNPEKLAYGGDGLPLVGLYGVTFDMGDVWGGHYLRDKLVIDIYEHWLEPG